jgi:UPF0755 protein
LKRLLGWLLLALLLAAVGAGGLAWWLLGAPNPQDTRTVAFEVRPGSGARQVAADLQAAGLVRDARALLAVLLWRGDQGRVGAGLYQLQPSLDAFEMATALVRGGLPRTTRVTIPEGLRAGAVVARIESGAWANPPAELGAWVAAPPPQLQPASLPPGSSLEGYLFPDTYDWPVGWGAEEILQSLLARFERELNETNRAALAEAGLGVHEWVILASMVQAEAANDAEMPIIAGVFLNRLGMGMPLQSDPTVAYGLGKELPQLDRGAGDFERDHPYNTYTRAGLPAGPISNPGAAALASVLNPQRSNERGQAWLYFMHGVDAGAPVFRPNVSFDAHLRDVNRYLR